MNVQPDVPLLGGEHPRSRRRLGTAAERLTQSMTHAHFVIAMIRHTLRRERVTPVQSQCRRADFSDLRLAVTKPLTAETRVRPRRSVHDLSTSSPLTVLIAEGLGEEPRHSAVG